MTGVQTCALPISVHTGGEQTILRRQGDRMRTRLVGPDNSLLRSGGRMTLPMTLTVGADRKSLHIEIEGSEAFELPMRTYSPWIRLVFRPALHVKVHGIARFYLRFGGSISCELQCSSGRYDLSTFASIEVGVHGSEVASRSGELPTFEVARLEVLAVR